MLVALGGQAVALESRVWIVAGSFRNQGYADFQTDAVRKASAAVERCGLRAFNDFSGKFGFAEGYDVVVVGPYKTRREANATLIRLKSCVPDAYIKQGRYNGPLT